jgi:aminoglycoside phosphotransferase (APT) family kinase protein
VGLELGRKAGAIGAGLRGTARVGRRRRRSARLRVCAIHGDFHTGNVLVRDGRVVGIVDWQYSRRDWPALELAGMVWDLSSDGSSTTIDRALRDDLIQKYVDSGGPGEAAAVVPMMRLESLVSALISLTRAAKGLPWNREFTRLLVATLDELV